MTAVLFVCTGNVARSPMAARLLEELAGPGGRYAARAVGLASWATQRLTTRDLAWADVVLVMEHGHLAEIRRHWPDHARKVHVLDVPDEYDPDEADLRKVLTDKLRALLPALDSIVAPPGRPPGPPAT